MHLAGLVIMAHEMGNTVRVSYDYLLIRPLSDGEVLVLYPGGASAACLTALGQGGLLPSRFTLRFSPSLVAFERVHTPWYLLCRNMGNGRGEHRLRRGCAVREDRAPT